MGLVLSMVLAAVSSISFAEEIEVGSPLPGRVKIIAASEGTVRRIQISGSLSPLRVFMNGLDRTKDIGQGECHPESEIAFNDLPIEAQGPRGIFYWEGQQVQEELVLRLKVKGSCLALKSRIPLTMFERPFREEIYLRDDETPLKWKIKLTGEKIEGLELRMDQGEMKEEGGVVNYTLELVEGKNTITGVVLDHGKETPLDLKFDLTIQRTDPKAAGLIMSIQEKEKKLFLQGKVNVGSTLTLNDDQVKVDAGKFKTKMDLETGTNQLHVVTESSAGEKAEFKKTYECEPEIDKPWPLLPTLSYVGLSFLSANAHYSAYSSDLRVEEGIGSNFIWGREWGKGKVPIEIYFRSSKDQDVFPSKKETPITLTSQIGLGAIRLYPWRKAIHYGLGLGYHQLTKQQRVSRPIGPPVSETKDLRDIRIIGRIGWTITFGSRWAWMATFSPFVAIPLTEKWESYGFDLMPFTLVYSY